MGYFYRGSGLSYERVGNCSDGDIYRCSGWSGEQIGGYKDGYIYRGSGISYEQVGCYQDGYIYRGGGISFEQIGTYSDGYIYRGGVLYREQVGAYDGDPAEAAAYLLLVHNGGESSSAPAADTVPATRGESGGYTRSGGSRTGDAVSGILGALLAPLGILLLVFLSGLAWWAAYRATAVADIPYLVVFVLSIALGLFLGMAVFKADSVKALYMTTVAIASVINIVTGILTRGGQPVIAVLFAAPIVTALAAMLPAGITYIAVNLIRTGMAKGRERRAQRQDAPQPKPAAQAKPAAQSAQSAAEEERLIQEMMRTLELQMRRGSR